MCLVNDLTELEKGTLAFYAWGLSIQEIAFERGRARQTVELAMRRIRQKLGIWNAARLIHFAVATGLIPLAHSATNDLTALLPPAPQGLTVTQSWRILPPPGTNYAPKHIQLAWDYAPTNGPVYFAVDLSTNSPAGPWAHWTNWDSSPIEVPATFPKAFFRIAALRRYPWIPVP